MAKPSKKTVEQGKQTALRALFPPKVVEYIPENADRNARPVRIEVMPFPASQLPVVSDAAIKLGTLFYKENKTLAEIAVMAPGEVIQILRPLVSIPEHEELTVDDLPIDCLPEILRAVVQTISKKKWQSLGEETLKSLGLEGWATEFTQKMKTISETANFSDLESGGSTGKTGSESVSPHS